MGFSIREVVLLMCLGMLLQLASNAYAAKEESSKLQVSQSSMSFMKHETVTYVSSVGEIKNNTNNPISNITLEARFYDAQGKLIDVASNHLYETVVPPHGEVAFKLETDAAAVQEKYATYNVRVVGMDQRKPYHQAYVEHGRKKKSLLWDLFVSWFPMVLLILVWLFLVKRFSGKNSPQKKSLELVGKQNELFEKQNKVLERIADAVEGKDMK